MDTGSNALRLMVVSGGGGGVLTECKVAFY